MKNRNKPYKRPQRVDGILVEGQSELKPRPCAGHCGKDFHPTHKGNFVCPACTIINEGINGREYKIGRKI